MKGIFWDMGQKSAKFLLSQKFNATLFEMLKHALLNHVEAVENWVVL